MLEIHLIADFSAKRQRRKMNGKTDSNINIIDDRIKQHLSMWQRRP
jgi:hypothetical protein